MYDDSYMIMPIVIGIISFLIVLAICFLWSKRHKDFISNAYSIHNGMSKSEVLSIMGQPTTVEQDGNKTILIFEKDQWRGWLRGGTLTRAVKVVLENDKVISVSNKNLNKSTW